MVRKRVYGDKLFYLLTMAIIEAMAVIVLITNGLSILLLLPPLVLLIPIIIDNIDSQSRYLYIYLSLALAVFYSSICVYNLIPLALHVVTSIKYSRPPDISKAKHFLSVGALGPSTIVFLKPLFVFLIIVLINYRAVLSISVILLILLIYTLQRYIVLLKMEAPAISYPEKIPLGKDLYIKVKIKSDKHIWVQLIYMGQSKLYKVSGEELIRIKIFTHVLGKHRFLLRVYVYDNDLFARRLVLEKPILLHVVPSFEYLLKYTETKILSRADVRQMLEPVETRLFFIEAGQKEPLKSVGYEDIEAILSFLPYFIRVIVQTLMSIGSGIGSGLSRGKEDIEEGGRKGVFGEYSGVRYYVPGDRLKNIHWKKTVSRQTLVVKEYTSGGKGEVASFMQRYGPVIVLDLSVSSILELDSILKKFIELLIVSYKSTPLSRILALFVIGDNIVVSLQGKTIDILNTIANKLASIMPKVIYEYETFGTMLEEHFIKEFLSSMNNYSLIKFIAEPNIVYAKKFVEILVNNNVLPRRNIIIVHGSSSTLKCSFLKHYLEENGFRVESLYEKTVLIEG